MQSCTSIWDPELFYTGPGGSWESLKEWLELSEQSAQLLTVCWDHLTSNPCSTFLCIIPQWIVLHFLICWNAWNPVATGRNPVAKGVCHFLCSLLFPAICSSSLSPPATQLSGDPASGWSAWVWMSEVTPTPGLSVEMTSLMHSCHTRISAGSALIACYCVRALTSLRVSLSSA